MVHLLSTLRGLLDFVQKHAGSIFWQATRIPTTKLPKQPRIVVDFELLRSYAAQNFRDLGGHPAR